jgi:small subunit ribosomal protein S18
MAEDPKTPPPQPSAGGREGRPGGGPGGLRKGKRQFFRKKKVCKFCVEKVDFIDYKKAEILAPFVQERGKILPRRMTGTCSRHQRWLGEAIKRARNIALLPFAGLAEGAASSLRGGGRGDRGDRGDRGERGDRGDRSERGERAEARG